MKLDAYKALYDQDRFFNEVFKDQIYSDVLHKKKNVVVDIGALAGEFSFWIYPDAGIIYSIEPEDESYKELESNVKVFEFDKVKPFRLAIAGENKERNLSMGGRGGHALRGESGGQMVQAKTLATFMKDNNIAEIDILKIDVEGAEDEIFKADDFKTVVDKIGCIIGEHLDGVENILNNFGFKSVRRHGRNLFLERV